MSSHKKIRHIIWTEKDRRRNYNIVHSSKSNIRSVRTPFFSAFQRNSPIFELCKETHDDVLRTSKCIDHLRDLNPRFSEYRFHKLIDYMINFRNSLTHRTGYTADAFCMTINMAIELLEMVGVDKNDADIFLLRKLTQAIRSWKEWSDSEKQESVNELQELVAMLNQYFEAQRLMGHST